MTGAIAVYLISGVLGGFWPTFGRDPLADPFPLEAKGDIRFQADAARFLEDGKPVVEISIAIPDPALGGATDSARVLTEVELLDAEGKGKAQFKTELTLPPAPTEGDTEHSGMLEAGRWLRLHPALLEGTSGVRVRIEDLSKLKTGLYDRMRKKHLYGEAAGRLHTDPEAPLKSLEWMSDLLFVWGPASRVSAGQPEKGLRSVRARFEPNPYRYYGLYQPILTVYWELYPGSGSVRQTTGDPVIARYRILSAEDAHEVHRTTDTLRWETGPTWTLKRFDLSKLRAGSYQCEVTLLDQPHAGADPLATTKGLFQVVWEKGSWMSNQALLLEYGRALLPADEFDRFSSLDRGGMEAYLRDLWNRHAPTSPGEANPLERRFLDRAEYAATNFKGHRSGVLSDRGLVYIRFGPPDELREQLNPQDEELLWLALPDEMWGQGRNEGDPAAPLARPRSRLDNRAYQIWDYTARGDPLLPEYVNPGYSIGLKFIFVDEMGTGDYSMVYSSVPLQ